MIKLLIGGSPCTYWSIAQKNNREVAAEGLGWELFKNYLIAKEKFKPDIFLYENNKSAAQAIKDQIKKELNVYDGTMLMQDSGARYIEINSALVSAQSRQRFYIHNCGMVGQPKERGILLCDILERGLAVNTTKNGKSQAMRIFSVKGKSVTLSSGGGGLGGKTGLYAIPIGATQDNKAKTIKAQYSCTGIANIITNGGFGATGVALKIDAEQSTDDPTVIGKDPHSMQRIYEVKNQKITIKGAQYPIKLSDGFYNIRKLTVTECCRLQTMPDDYCRAVSNAQAYKGLGNGWTAEVIIHILQNALKDIPKDEKILVLSMYDGIGTGRYCLDKMGFTNVEYHAYEIDKYPAQIAMSNYPDIIQHGDAFALREENWNLRGAK